MCIQRPNLSASQTANNRKKDPGKQSVNTRVSYNPSNISRDINTQIKGQITKHLPNQPILKTVDASFYKPNKRATNPLLILKLHARLSQLRDHHLQLFCTLTDKATSYIGKELDQAIDNEEKVQNTLYISKFLAYQWLIHYLRETKRPTLEKIERYIRIGIYGHRKNKYTPRVKKRLVAWMNFYRRSGNGRQI